MRSQPFLSLRKCACAIQCIFDHVVESGHFASRSVRRRLQFWELLICLACLKELNLKAVRKEDYSMGLDFVVNYKDDLTPSSLKLQLELTTSFSTREHQPTLIEVRDYFRSLSPAQRVCMSEVFTLLKLINGNTCNKCC